MVSPMRRLWYLVALHGPPACSSEKDPQDRRGCMSQGGSWYQPSVVSSHGEDAASGYDGVSSTGEVTLRIDGELSIDATDEGIGDDDARARLGAGDWGLVIDVDPRRYVAGLGAGGARSGVERVAVTKSLRFP